MHCVKTGLGAPGVHPEPSLRTLTARTTLRSAVSQPCHGVHGAVSQAQHRSCRNVRHAPCRCRIAERVATHPSSQASACHDTTDCIVTHSPATRPLSPVTIQNFVSRHSPPARPRARAADRVVASLGRFAALPWPYRGPCCCA